MAPPPSPQKKKGRRRISLSSFSIATQDEEKEEEEEEEISFLSSLTQEIQRLLFNRDYYGEIALDIILVVFRDRNISTRSTEGIYLYLKLEIYSIEIQRLCFNREYCGEILSDNLVIEYLEIEYSIRIIQYLLSNRVEIIMFRDRNICIHILHQLLV